MTRPPLFLLAAAPLLAAATAPAGEGLSTPALFMVMTAIVGVVVLRGVLMRRHLRKRRGTERPASTGTVTKKDSGDGDTFTRE